MKQEDASDDQMTRFSEMTTTSSMYTTRRLRLLGQSAREPELMRWSQSIQPVRKKLALPPQQVPGAPTTAPGVRRPPAAQGPAPAPAPGAAQADSIRVVCNKCQTAMRIPLAVLRGKPSLNVRCPKCQNVFTLRPRSAAPPPAPGAAGTKPNVPQASAGAPAKPAAAAPAPTTAQTKPAAPAPASGAAKTKPTAAPALAATQAKSVATPATAAAHKQSR